MACVKYYMTNQSYKKITPYDKGVNMNKVYDQQHETMAEWK